MDEVAEGFDVLVEIGVNGLAEVADLVFINSEGVEEGVGEEVFEETGTFR